MTREEVIAKYGNEWPDEAIASLVAGCSWELKPELIGCGEDLWISYDDDYEGADGWRGYWHPRGLEVEDGKLIETFWTVDSDGDWDCYDSAEVGTPEHKALLEEFSYEQWEKQNAEYYAWVAENGEDPLSIFYVKQSTKKPQKWQFIYGKSIIGPRLSGARRNGRGAFMGAHELPESVRQYLLTDKTGKVDVESWDMLVEICRNSDIHLNRNKFFPATQIKGTVTIEVSVPNPNYTKELKALARKSLRELRRKTDPETAPIDDAAENARWEPIR